MKYIVELGYCDQYEFEDGDTAIRWAEVALTHSDKEDVRVVIEKEKKNEFKTSEEGESE